MPWDDAIVVSAGKLRKLWDSLSELRSSLCEGRLKRTVLRPALLIVKTAQFTQFFRQVWRHNIKIAQFNWECIEHFRPIPKDPSWILGRNTGCPDRHFSWFYSAPTVNFRVSSLGYARTTFIQITASFHSPFNLRSKNTVWYTDVVVKQTTELEFCKCQTHPASYNQRLMGSLELRRSGREAYNSSSSAGSNNSGAVPTLLSTPAERGVQYKCNFAFVAVFLLVWPLLPGHCRCRGLLLHLITRNYKSAGLLWVRDRPVAETCAWQHPFTGDTFMLPAGFEPAVPARKRP